MPTRIANPVLIIGGSGVVGAQAARTLRRIQPDLPIVIGGRDLAKAGAVAADIARSEAVRVDLDQRDLGLSQDAQYSAVVVFVKDDTLNSLRYAQAKGLPYLNVSNGVFEVGPEMALHVYNPMAAPILMASQWLAGATTLATLHFAAEFRRVDAFSLTAVLDEQDIGGPAAYADFERFNQAAPRPLQVRDGKWRWGSTEDNVRTVRAVDGVEMSVQSYTPFDVLSLGAATDACSVWFGLHIGTTASRRRGEPFSTEIIIEIEGESATGERAAVRYDLVHPGGQAPVTALAVALGVERLLGLHGGAAVAPGLYFPDNLIAPAYLVQRMQEFGLEIRRSDGIAANARRTAA